MEQADIGRIHFRTQSNHLANCDSCDVRIKQEEENGKEYYQIIANETVMFTHIEPALSPIKLQLMTEYGEEIQFPNKKKKGKTVFIDARNMGEMVDRKHRDFSDEDIKKLADTFEAFQNGELEDVKGFCAVVNTSEIAKQDYILTPGRYVGIAEQEDDGEPFEEKMDRLTSELSELFAKSHELEGEIRERLEAIGFEIK